MTFVEALKRKIPMAEGGKMGMAGRQTTKSRKPWRISTEQRQGWKVLTTSHTTSSA
jgi:hypothetical protein